MFSLHTYIVCSISWYWYLKKKIHEKNNNFNQNTFVIKNQIDYFWISKGNDFTEIITTYFVILMLFENTIANTCIKMFANNLSFVISFVFGWKKIKRGGSLQQQGLKRVP